MKRHSLFWIVGIVCAVLTASYYLPFHPASAPVPIVKTIVRLSFDTPNRLADTVIPSFQPIRTHQLAAVDFDQQGNFYILAIKRQAPHVLISNPQGQIIKTVPLLGPKKNLLPYWSDFFSVSASGRLWWTTRKRNSASNSRWQSDLITVHDQTGKTIQEWQQPDVDVGLIQAVSEKQLYVADTEGVIRIYTLGRSNPQLLNCTADFIDRSGTIWQMKPHNKSNGDVEYEVTTARLNRKTQIWGRLNFSSNRQNPYFLFCQESQRNLYAFRFLYDGKQIKSNQAKVVYNVNVKGEIQKVLDCSNLQIAPSNQSWVFGRLLSAHGKTVTMEVGRLSKGKVEEYRIVEVHSTD